MEDRFAKLPHATRQTLRAACATALMRSLADLRWALDDAPSPVARRSGLYAIVNAGPATSTDHIASRVNALEQAPLAFIQLRAKNVTAAQRLTLVRAALDAASVTPIIVNDDVQTALEAGAHGVHLGKTDGSVTDARRHTDGAGRADFIIGVSSNNAIQFSSAARDRVDYVALGPIFESPTKRGHAPPVGLDMLSEVAADAARPLCAIGGLVDVGRVCRAAFAGADYCAVVSALSECENETEAARALAFAHHIGQRVRAADRANDPAGVYP